MKNNPGLDGARTHDHMHMACIALPTELPNQAAVGMGEMVYEAGLGEGTFLGRKL